MNSNRNRVIGLLMRTMAVTVAGVIISIVFLSNLDTYSWFASSVNSSVKVTAAETKDILDLFELVYLNDSKKENPTALKIRKAPDLKSDPVIFFSIDGDIEDYVINVNPIKLVSEGTYIIPLEISCSTGQLLNSCEMPNIVEGSLRIEYLNDFISEELELSYTKTYILWNRYFNYVGKREIRIEEPNGRLRTVSLYGDGSGEEEISNKMMKAYISKSLIYLAKQTDWEKIEPEGEPLSDDYGIRLTLEQDEMIDIILPGLKEYIGNLTNTIDELKKKLADKEAELASLDEKMVILESQYEQLLEENASLSEQINSMTPVQPPVSTVPDNTSPPAAGGGSSGGGSSTPDVGTTPVDGTPTGDTGDSGTGDTDTGSGDTGDSGTGEGDTGTGDVDTETGDVDTETGDTGDIDTGEEDAGTGDTGDIDTGEVDTETGDTGDNGTGDVDAGTGDTGSDDADDESGDSESNDDVSEETTDPGEQDATVDGDENEDDSADTDTTDEDSETTEVISGE